MAGAAWADHDDIVRVGEGSYTSRPPAGLKRPQSTIHRSEALKGAPMPTNDWWSSLAWLPFSEAQFPHPLAMKAEKTGLRVWYPGSAITANTHGVFGAGAGEGDDLIIGHAEVDAFADARVDRFGDWTVTAVFDGGEGRKLRATYGHGLPFVYVRVEGGGARLRFKQAPQLWARHDQGSAIGLTVNGRHYGVFIGAGMAWDSLDDGRTWIMRGKDYLSVAVLPDDRPKTLELFHQHAHRHVTDTRVEWRYDQNTGAVETQFTFRTEALEGGGSGTIFAMYPHQWGHSTQRLIDVEYATVRGPMKVGVGSAFTTRMVFPGVLPTMPEVTGRDAERLRRYVRAFSQERTPRARDTYWTGKQLGRLATLLPIAEQAGEKQVAAETLARIKEMLEAFLAAHEEAGKPGADAGFYYDWNWGTLIGYPASYGSDAELNDHHFHYGYFIRAAAEIALRDPTWAKDERLGGMIKLIIRDIASPSRGDKLFPFLRCFDPYAGHSWASGHAKFGDGNNNESSSEAMNAWYGMILWGTATGDQATRDLGVWLYTTEMQAISNYWFDVADAFHPKEYVPSVVTMVWGGKGANATWFSPNPELVHGINWLPMHGGSLYLGRWPAYVAKNYEALKAEKGGDTRWEDWPDLVWMYLALHDADEALRQFDAAGDDKRLEDGNSRANVYHWISALKELGHVDRTISANCVFYSVFTRDGRRTYVAFNPDPAEAVVTFSDGTTVRCAPRGWGIQRAGE